MSETRRRSAVAALVVVLLVAGCAGAFGPDRDAGPRTTVAGTTDTAPGGGGGDGTPTATRDPDRTTVTVSAENGSTLGTVSVRVADTFAERYTGLSNTASLAPNEGMLFVHEEEGRHAYVMRNMAFPIDIVFVDANGTITAIHHAKPESRPYTRYRGRGRYVLEVPYGWTTEHGVEVGDRIRIDYATEG